MLIQATDILLARGVYDWAGLGVPRQALRRERRRRCSPQIPCCSFANSILLRRGAPRLACRMVLPPVPITGETEERGIRRLTFR